METEETKSDSIIMDSQLTNNPIHLQKILDYFKAFNEKDLDTLSDLYSEDVTLKDWMGKWETKPLVLEENQNLFISQPNLKITLNRIENKSTTSYCYISIVLEDTKLEVLDCIYFNEEGKISHIEAILRDTTDTKVPNWMEEKGL
jgi:hypothetical protein